MSDRGATSFLVAAARKPTAELQAIMADEAKLMVAAEYHGIDPEWARFWIGEELNRIDRRN